jgi:hypothetical protein
MKDLRAATAILLMLMTGLVFGLGCDKSSAPPQPLALEEVPAALQKSFSKAKGESKELVTQIVATLQAQDYSTAYLSIQKLAAQSGLNKDQQSAASRATLAINTALQSAQTKGDAKAAETLKAYRVNK